VYGWFSLYHFVTHFVIAICVPSLGWLEQQTTTITDVVFLNFCEVKQVEDLTPENATNFNEIIVKKKTTLF
jgi:hypothetical protein